MKNKNLTIIFFVATILIIGIFSIYILAGKQDNRNLTNFAPSTFSLPKDEERVAKNDLPKNNDRNLKFIFWGDVMLDRNVKNKINKNGFAYLLATTSENQWQFNNYDLVSANLEGAVTDKGAHYRPEMAYDFAFLPDDVAKLQSHSFNFFNIANNHLADQGERGIIETRENLQELGLNYSGCDDKKVGECSYKILEIGGKKVSMIGLSMVYGEFDRKKTNALIRALASSTDLEIVNIHWGTEYQHQFSKLQQQIGYELIDNGADIIIGHHPHVVQGMEIYESKRAVTNGARANWKKGVIFYSLGNFIFDQYFSLDTQEGLGVAVEFNNDKFIFTFLPVKSKASQVELMTTADKNKFLNKFSGWSDLDLAEKEEIKLGKLELAL